MSRDISKTPKTKMAIVSLTENLSIHFIYIPDGYVISKLNLENHETMILGRLNQFNRLKILKELKKGTGDLRIFFTKNLESKGWNFKEFPNPVAYACKLIQEKK